MPQTRLLIVDDHALMCLGLRAILEPEYRVVGAVQEGESVLAAVDQLHPDVVLLDLSLPGKNGAEVLQELVARGPAPAVVILTMHVDRSLAEHLIRLGAHGFVPKDARLPELREAIEAARTGRRFISPRVPGRADPPASRYPRGYLQLSERQRHIVRMIGAGLTSERIADDLHISYHTVHYHRTSIRKKLGFQTDYEMNRFALLVLQGDAPDPAHVALSESAEPVRPGA